MQHDGLSLSDYEKQRQQNIAANNAVLHSLGLSGGGGNGNGSFVPARPKPVPRKKKNKKKPQAANPLDARKSSRLDGLTSPSYAESQRALDAAEPDGGSGGRRRQAVMAPREERVVSYAAREPKKEKPADVFGELPGFPVGSGWEMRTHCCEDLVHRATVAGIVGRPDDGCYSIVLNGGYADDQDLGEALTYTGSGGRSLKGTASNPKNLRTGPATKNQTLEGTEGRYNAALYRSFETGTPVRVVRGYKLDSEWAPIGLDCGGDYNYRYDGLYTVLKAWDPVGLEGYRVWKFALLRLKGQAPLRLRQEEMAAAEEEGGAESGEEGDEEGGKEQVPPRPAAGGTKAKGGGVALTATGARRCGTPGCTLPDYHQGACSSLAVAGKRRRASEL